MPEILIPTRILRPFGQYAPGEIAGFVEEKVAKFEEQGAVERVKVDEAGNVIEEIAAVEEATTEAPEEVKPSQGGATARGGRR